MTNNDLLQRFVDGKVGKINNLYIKNDYRAANVTVLYNYATPIAVRIENPSGVVFLLNPDKYSVTTTKIQSKLSFIIGQSGHAHGNLWTDKNYEEVDARHYFIDGRGMHRDTPFKKFI